MVLISPRVASQAALPRSRSSSPMPGAMWSPDTILAVRLHHQGRPPVLRLDEVPLPQPGPGEVLVKVEAAGCNPVDWKQATAALPGKMQLPQTLGRDVAGTVEGLGPDTHKFGLGERVFAMTPFGRDGTFAEAVVVPDTVLARMPERLDFVAAAALPLVALTAWQALIDTAELAQGETVFLRGAAGGVGSLAVQIAKARGARVIATASEASKDYVAGLGADLVLPHDVRHGDVPGPIHVVFDLRGGEDQARDAILLAAGGRLVSTVQPPDTEELAARGAVGHLVIVQSDGNQLAEIARLVQLGRLRAPQITTKPLAAADEALAALAAGQVRGKLVLQVPT